MPKTTKKQSFVRSEISHREKLLGAGILVLLAAVGVAVAIKGRVYDPAKFSVDPATLEFTRSAVIGKAATLRTDDGMRTFETTSRPDTGNTSELSVAGLKPLGPTESYTADTLFEKINGRAPAYFEFGFKDLATRSFGIPGQEGQYLDVFVFTMDSPVNAFGIFSMERGGEGASVDFALDGYRSEMGYFFRQGPAYIQVLASDVSEVIMAPAEQAARALAAQFPIDDTGIQARSKLPSDGQIPGSVNFIRKNAYGQAALKNTFEAKYHVGDSKLTYFAAAGNEDTYQTLKAFFSEYGSIKESGEQEGARFFVGENFGQFSIIHTDGETLTGVMNTDDADAARAFVERVQAAGKRGAGVLE